MVQRGRVPLAACAALVLAAALVLIQSISGSQPPAPPTRGGAPGLRSLHASSPNGFLTGGDTIRNVSPFVAPDG